MAPPGLSIIAILVIALFSGCAWYPPSMDDRIAELKKEVGDKRKVLTGLADQGYRGMPGKDFEIDVSERPITDTLEHFNSLPPGDHIMSMVETSAGGRLWELRSGWCPWPFTGGFGIFLEPANIRGAFFAGVYIQELKYLSWKAGNGLEYALVGNLNLGYMLVLGSVEFCFGSAPILPIPVVILGGNQYATGDSTLTPVPDQGISYVLKLRDPLYFVAVVYVVGWTIPVPFTHKPELLSGQLKNMLGKEGGVRIGTGEISKYSLDTKFDQASFVDHGLITSGSLVIHWQ